MSLDRLTHLSLKAELAAAITDAAENNTQVRIGDGGGLMLVVRANGAASWVLRYSFRAQRRDLTIGKWPTVTLKMARDEAAKARVIMASGRDPMAARQAEREERKPAKSADTLRALFEQWLEHSDHSNVYKGNIEAAFMKDVLPAVGALPPETVTRDDLVKIMRTIEARGAVVMVRRVRMWLRQMFDYGIEHEDRPLLKMSPVPMGTLKSFKSVKTRHFPAITNAHEVSALMQRLHAVTDNFVIRTALLLSAHTFQRPSEIREATWSEFDLEAARWVIPAERMKSRLEHWVPLSRQVMEMLRVHAGVVGTAGMLFPGRRYGQPISEGTLTGRLNTMGYLGKHSPHGFRAMARTVMDEHLKVDPRFIEKQLAHESDTSGLRGAYNRAAYWDERVMMMQQWSDWLSSTVAVNSLGLAA